MAVSIFICSLLNQYIRVDTLNVLIWNTCLFFTDCSHSTIGVTRPWKVSFVSDKVQSHTSSYTYFRCYLHFRTFCKIYVFRLSDNAPETVRLFVWSFFADHLIISMHTPYAYVLVKWFYILLASIYFTSYFVNDRFIYIIFLISDNCNVRTAWTCLIEFQHQIQKEWRQSRWCEYWTIVSNFVMDDCKLSVTLNLDLVLS